MPSKKVTKAVLENDVYQLELEIEYLRTMNSKLNEENKILQAALWDTPDDRPFAFACGLLTTIAAAGIAWFCMWLAA